MRFDNPLRALQHLTTLVLRGHEAEPQPAAGQTPDLATTLLDPTTRLALAVDAQGRVNIRESTPTGQLDNEQRLLSEILNKPYQSFKAYAGGQLIDAQGFAVRAGATAHTVHAFVSSRPYRGGGDPPVIPFDATHLAQKSGIFEGAGEKAWTLHNKQIYRLGDDNNWHAAGLPDAHDGKFKALTLNGNHLHALDEAGGAWTLHDNQLVQVPFTHPVNAIAIRDDQIFGVAMHNGAAYLKEPGLQGRSTQLTVNSVRIGDKKADKPAAIGVTGSQLLMVDGAGRLHKVQLPEGERWPATLNLQPHSARELVVAEFGKLTFSGLFTDHGRNLNARFKDAHGNEHTARWQQVDFLAGWNLSQSTAVVRQQNLPALEPEEHEVIHLDGGSVAHKNGQLLIKDLRTDTWSKGTESGLQDLHQGNDGFAYVVDKEGAVKRLVVQPQALSRTMGSGPDLTTGQSAEVKAGATLRGAHDVVAEKIAVLNDDRYVTLSDGHLCTHDQRGTRQRLPPLPGFGDEEALGIPDPHEVDRRHIQDITIAGGDLYVLKAGALFRMAAEHWQGGKHGLGVHHQDQSAWTLVENLAAGVSLDNIRTSPEGALLVKHGETVQRVSADGSLTAPVPQTARLTQQHDFYNRMVDREHALGRFTRHGNFKVNASVLGRANIETVTAREATPGPLNYLRSHLRIGSGVRKPFDMATHLLNGRKGLADVYRAESDMLARLDQRWSITTEVPTMSTRLEQIRSNGAFISNPRADLLADVIERATQAVVEDTERVLRSLAQDHVVITSDGQSNPAFKPSRPVSNDMVARLAHSLEKSGVIATPLNALLKQLMSQGFKLTHRTPGGERERDRGDAQALVKARLALNADVLFRLHRQLHLLASAARAGNTSNAFLDGVADTVEQTYAKEYINAPLKKYTDAGFRSYKELEACYDASKTMLRYFRDEKHPMTQNLRAGMNVSPELMSKGLTTALRQLKPRDTLKISRNYACNVTAGVSSPVTGLTFLGGRLNVEPERTYGLTFTRFERGLKVWLSRDGAVAGGANIGFGAGFTNHAAPKHDISASLMQNGSWLGVSADLRYRHTQSNALSFFVRDEDIEGLVTDLTSKSLQKSGEAEREVANRLHPLAFLDESFEQELRTGAKHSADVDLNLGAEYRLNAGQLGAKQAKVFLRASAGAVGTANLASYERERVTGRGSDGLHTDIRTDNRVRFLEKGGATAYARLFDTAFSSQPNHVFLLGGVPTGVTASVVLENKTGKAFDIRFKNTLPLLPTETKALASTLEKAFPLIDAPDLSGKDAKAQLRTLRTVYAPASVERDKPLTDAQYVALKSLGQTQRQEEAADQNTRLMTHMEFITKQGNVNRIDHSSNAKRVSDPVRAWLCGTTNPGNAEKIATLMKKDAHLAGLMKELQDRKGTTRAELRLELTDDAKVEIDNQAIAGAVSDAVLKAILDDERNFRIKSISVFRSAAKEDSFTLPGFWANFRSGSTVSVERLRGEITFSYAEAQQTPVGYKLEGQLTAERNTPSLMSMAKQEAGRYRAT